MPRKYDKNLKIMPGFCQTEEEWRHIRDLPEKLREYKKQMRKLKAARNGHIGPTNDEKLDDRNEQLRAIVAGTQQGENR